MYMYMCNENMMLYKYTTFYYILIAIVVIIMLYHAT